MSTPPRKKPRTGSPSPKRVRSRSPTPSLEGVSPIAGPQGRSSPIGQRASSPALGLGSPILDLDISDIGTAPQSSPAQSPGDRRFSSSSPNISRIGAPTVSTPPSGGLGPGLFDLDISGIGAPPRSSPSSRRGQRPTSPNISGIGRVPSPSSLNVSSISGISPPNISPISGPGQGVGQPRFSLESLRDIDVSDLDFGQLSQGSNQPFDRSTTSEQGGQQSSGGLDTSSSGNFDPFIDFAPEHRAHYENLGIMEFVILKIDFIDMNNVYMMMGDNRYLFELKQIGEGTFAYIYKAIRADTLGSPAPIERAIKVTICRPNSSDQIAFDRELIIIDMLKESPHPNILRFFEHYEDKTVRDDNKNRNYLVMELSPIGSVMDAMHVEDQSGQKMWMPLQEVYCRHFMKGIAQGLKHLHSLGIAHGDLKLQNILLFWKEDQVSQDTTEQRFLQMIPKLIDFNNSKVGTPGEPIMNSDPRCALYAAAPESWHSDQEYDMIKADVYSLGACLLTLLIAAIPFEPPKDFDKSDRDVYTRYVNDLKKEGTLLRQLIQPFDQQLQQLLLRTMEPLPQNRITFDEFLADPWMQ